MPAKNKNTLCHAEQHTAQQSNPNKYHAPTRLRPLAAALVLALNGSTISALPTLGAIALTFGATSTRDAKAQVNDGCSGSPSANCTDVPVNGIKYTSGVTEVKVGDGVAGTTTVTPGTIGIQLARTGSAGANAGAAGFQVIAYDIDPSDKVNAKLVVSSNGTTPRLSGGYYIISSGGATPTYTIGPTSYTGVQLAQFLAATPTDDKGANITGSLTINNNVDINGPNPAAGAPMTTTNADGIRISSTGGKGGNGGCTTIILASWCDDGDWGGNAGSVVVNSNALITVFGTSAGKHGITALSQGGAGGNGGGYLGLFASVAGDGGNAGSGALVVVNNMADISTHGDRAHGIFAESAGGNGGDGGFGGSLGYSEGGNGGAAGAGGDVSVTNHGHIQTSDAVTNLISIPVYIEIPELGLKIPDPTGRTEQVLGPEGDGSYGIYARSLGGRGGNGKIAGGIISASGDGGGSAKAGTVTVVNSGQIDAAGKQSTAIFAESVGGGGGDAALGIGFYSIGGDGQSGGDGGAVLVTNSGQLTTQAAPGQSGGTYSALGIFAQSIGGGGGHGGDALSVAPVFSLGIGGDGGGGGSGGTVGVTSTGAANSPADYFDISTSGSYSHGIQAQSVGGGGGTGGGVISIAASIPKVPLSLAIAIGGDGGNGGSGSTVTVSNSSKIQTSGARAYGILGQSIGGGGGDGGYSVALAVSAGENLANLGLSLGGSGSVGGNGDQVTVTNTGAINTQAQKSHGIVAQSVGGGGGMGGFAVAGALSVNNPAPKNITLAIGGSGGGGGNSGFVKVTNTGHITTSSSPVDEGDLQGTSGCAVAEADCAAVDPLQKFGKGSIGILAQSIGGGGGDGGHSFAGSFGVGRAAGNSINVAVSVGGSGGDGGWSGTPTPYGYTAVDVLNYGDIDTSGENSHGILAQSIGGGGGIGGNSLAAGLGFGSRLKDNINLNLSIAVGGGGGAGNSAGSVDVLNGGNITTKQADSRGIFAQSIGGGGGVGGDSFTATIGLDSVSEGHTVNGRISVGGKGGDGNTGGDVRIINSGILATSEARSDGIFAQSIGGGGGNGGQASGLSFRMAGGTLQQNIKKPGSNWNFVVDVGGTGGMGNTGGQVFVNNGGKITTKGEQSRGIFAQSIGGGGGNGGEGINGTGVTEVDGAVVVLDQPGGSGNIITKTLMAQLRDWTFTVGGDGGTNGHGDTVTVMNSAMIETNGNSSEAILAQSIGGGGGVAQGYVQGPDGSGGVASAGATGKINLGGKGGSAGNGGDVTVNNQGILLTTQKESSGIFAQSVGGGGGIAGNVDRLFSDTPNPVSFLIPGTNLGLGLDLGQAGGSAGNGGTVTVTNGADITTRGDDAHGIWAQSVGGGGGKASGLGTGLVLQYSFAGSVGGIGKGGGVVVHQDAGTITTNGEGSHGIYAQSSAGRSVVPGEFSAEIIVLNTRISQLDDSIPAMLQSEKLLKDAGLLLPDSPLLSTGLIEERAFKVARRDLIVGLNDGTIKSASSAISINVAGNVIANGTLSNGIDAQSQGGDGNGNIDINISGLVQGGKDGGAGVAIKDGAANTLTITNTGEVKTAEGLVGYAIVGKDGNEIVDNSGMVTGSVGLGGGSNEFNNLAEGRLNAGDTVNVGAGNTFKNDGALSPGGLGSYQVTDITGNLVQTATGKVVTDLDFLAARVDRSNVSGTSSLDGTIAINLVNPGDASPGSQQFTILSSAGGVIEKSNLALSVAPSAVIGYELLYPNSTDVDLGYSVDFSPTGLGGNQSAIGNYVNAIQQAGGAPEFAPIAALLVSIPDVGRLGNAYDQLSPEPLLATTTTAVMSDLRFSDALHSCRVREGEFRFVSEGECSWVRLIGSKLDQDRTDTNPGFNRKTNTMAAGAQKRVNQNWSAGFGFSIDTSTLHVADNTRSEGNQYALGVIAKRNLGADAFTASLNLGYGPYDSTRQVNLIGPVIAASKQNVGLASAHVRWSRDYEHKNVWYLRPLLDVGVTHVYHGAFDEQGAGAANLSARSGRDTLVSLQPGLEFGREFATAGGTLIRPFGMVGLTHFVSGTTTGVTASLRGAPVGTAPFTTESTMDKTYADLTLGMDALGTNGAVFRISYSGQFSGHTESHSASLKAAIPF